MFAATNTSPETYARFARIPVLFACALSISACGSKIPDVTGVASNFRSTDNDGFVVWDTLFDEQNTQHLDDNNIGFALKSGIDANGTAITFAGLVNEDDIAPPTGGGIAVYRGSARAVSMTEPSDLFVIATLGLVDGEVSREYYTAPVTIQANLDDGSFRGENENTTREGAFSHRFEGKFVNGRMTGEGFINIGTLASLGTKLEGRIGDDQTTLVFKATRPDRIAIAGGMNLERSN